MRSESGSENALRRSASLMDDTLDYELPTPSPIPSPHQHHATPPPHSTSTDSMRHIGLASLVDGGSSDAENLPSTPTTSRSTTKYGSTRDLPKNWSDDESGTVTEPESVKSADEFLPAPHHRAHSKSSSSHHNHEGRRSSVQETSDTGASPGLKPEKERSSKRSSANARVSPRVDKKSASAYATIVSKEKLERANHPTLQWVRERMAPFRLPHSIDNWDCFKDGVVLIHLIYCCDSSIINLEAFDMSEPLRTLEAAFDVAERQLGIPNLFDAKSLMDSKLADRGPDLKTFILYISLFKAVHSERHRAENPVKTTHSMLADLKNLVSRKLAQVERLNDEFQHQTQRMQALSTHDELQAERLYLQRRALTMDRMMEMSRQLNSDLEAQNLALREQNRLLSEKISHLSKALENEKHEKEAVLAQMEMTERIKAMAELLQETDLDHYIELHKDEIDRLASEMDPNARPSTSKPTENSS